MMRLLLVSLALISFFSLSIGQNNTVGLLSYNPSKAYEGYNLIYPHNQPNVFILDNCGEIVHVWEDEADFRPGNTAYIMEDGRLIKTKRPAVVSNDPIWAGGGGAFVEIRDWDNNLLWSFEQNDAQARLHHDIAPMPNGNILMIVWELKTAQEAIDAGRDTALLTEGELWPDYIIEVDPTTDEIVWEWHVWDHLVQDFDATKDNFGVVADNPEKVDINWDTSDGEADWMHSNALDFNAELNQIVLSVPTFHEIWVIDHSTTTAEAAGSVGGLSGRGGDLMYRWGNPAAYDRGTEDDQKLFYQHDIHWIGQFLEPTQPDYGKFMVFNNRVGADFSTVNIFAPPWDMYEWKYFLTGGNPWEPVNFDWTYTHPEAGKMYSTGLSSVQRLPNGNTLICVGRFGYSFEITPDEEIVWEYKTPLLSGNPVSQGDTLGLNNNLTFRATRYPADFPAFDGKDLSPSGFIELNPDTSFCDDILSSVQFIQDYKLRLFPNPANDRLVIDWEGDIYEEIEVFDVLGRRVDVMQVMSGRKYLDTSNWEEGVYFIRIGKSQLKKLVISH